MMQINFFPIRLDGKRNAMTLSLLQTGHTSGHPHATFPQSSVYAFRCWRPFCAGTRLLTTYVAWGLCPLLNAGRDVANWVTIYMPGGGWFDQVLLDSDHTRNQRHHGSLGTSLPWGSSPKLVVCWHWNWHTVRNGLCLAGDGKTCYCPHLEPNVGSFAP